jgi:4-hydroxy-L-threonine phosphate dehydrogenase PdxA
MTNPHASALGKLGKGKKKTLTPAEVRRRTTQLAEARKKRWAGRKSSDR